MSPSGVLVVTHSVLTAMKFLLLPGGCGPAHLGSGSRPRPARPRGARHARGGGSGRADCKHGPPPGANPPRWAGRRAVGFTARQLATLLTSANRRSNIRAVR